MKHNETFQNDRGLTKSNTICIASGPFVVTSWGYGVCLHPCVQHCAGTGEVLSIEVIRCVVWPWCFARTRLYKGPLHHGMCPYGGLTLHVFSLGGVLKLGAK